MTDASTSSSAPPPTPLRKTRYVGFRLTDVQDSFVRMMAKKHGTTVSGFMGFLIERRMSEHDKQITAVLDGLKL